MGILHVGFWWGKNKKPFVTIEHRIWHYTDNPNSRSNGQMLVWGHYADTICITGFENNAIVKINGESRFEIEYVESIEYGGMVVRTT